MDPSGKLIYTRNNEVLSTNLQTVQDDVIPEGNRVPLSIKELGTTEIYATALMHSPNGRFVTVVGDGEYIVYTALAWRNKAFGNGNSFAWAGDSNTYAVLEGRMKVRVYKNFRERGANCPRIRSRGEVEANRRQGTRCLAVRSCARELREGRRPQRADAATASHRRP